MMNLIKSTIRIIKSILVFVILFCLIVFMVSNRQIITIRTYPLPFSVEARVFLVMIFFFLSGLFVGFLIFSKSLISSFLGGVKDNYKIKKLEKKALKK